MVPNKPSLLVPDGPVRINYGGYELHPGDEFITHEGVTIIIRAGVEFAGHPTHIGILKDEPKLDKIETGHLYELHCRSCGLLSPIAKSIGYPIGKRFRCPLCSGILTATAENSTTIAIRPSLPESLHAEVCQTEADEPTVVGVK